MSKSTYILLFALLIAILFLFSYHDTLSYPFQFDDENVIQKNIEIRSLHNLFNLDFLLDINKRPVSMLSFSFNYFLDGLNVKGYHLLNLFLHLICSILAGLFFHILVKVSGWKVKSQEFIVLMVIGLFLLHPIQTQAVTYISQRMAILAAIFYFLSNISYIKLRNSSKLRGIIFYALVCILSMILAVLSKQNAASIPLSLIAIEFMLFKTKRNHLRIGLVGAFSVLVFLLGYFLVQQHNLVITETKLLSPWIYFMHQPYVICKYILLFIFPIGQNIDHSISISNTIFNWNLILGFFGLLSFLVLAAYWLKINRLLSFFIVWFFITISIESSFISIRDLMFEHRMYLPVFGIISITVLLINKLKNEKYKIILAFSILIIMSVFTFNRNQVWSSKLSLWENAFKGSPLKPRVLNNLAIAYQDNGQIAKANELFEKAIEINPEYVEAQNNKGLIELENGNFETAIHHFNKVIAINPTNYFAYNNIGYCWFSIGVNGQALNNYKKAIYWNSNFFDAQFNLAVLYENNRNYSKAVTTYYKALEIKKDSKAYFNLANTYFKLNELDSAIQFYENAIKLNPSYVDAISNKGNAFFMKKDYKSSLESFEKCLAFEPNRKDIKENIEIVKSYLTDK